MNSIDQRPPGASQPEAYRMSREERDLTIRWVRQIRREPMPAEYRSRIARRHETLHARLKAIDPRTLPSEPSPRQEAAA